MRISSVLVRALAMAGLFGFGLTASADTLSSCKSEAGRARYDTEAGCYGSYGPQSGNWTVADRGALDICLASVEKQYSVEVNDCRSMYMASGDPRAPYENRELAASSTISLSLALWVLFAL